MTKFEQALSENGLLTGQAESDAKLVAAYELGIWHGEDADRKSIQRAAQVDTTLRIMVVLMRQMEKIWRKSWYSFRFQSRIGIFIGRSWESESPREKNSCL